MDATKVAFVEKFWNAFNHISSAPARRMLAWMAFIMFALFPAFEKAAKDQADIMALGPVFTSQYVSPTWDAAGKKVTFTVPDVFDSEWTITKVEAVAVDMNHNGPYVWTPVNYGPNPVTIPWSGANVNVWRLMIQVHATARGKPFTIRLYSEWYRP
jgi:hypothetical protein